MAKLTKSTLMKFAVNEKGHECSDNAGDLPPSYKWRQQDYRGGRPACRAAHWAGNVIVWLKNNPDKTLSEYVPKRRNTPDHVCSDQVGDLPASQLWRDQDKLAGRPICEAARWATNVYAWQRNYPGRSIAEYRTNKEKWAQYNQESYHICSDDPNFFQEDTARFYQQDRRRGVKPCPAGSKSYSRYMTKVNRRRLNGG